MSTQASRVESLELGGESVHARVMAVTSAVVNLGNYGG